MQLWKESSVALTGRGGVLPAVIAEAVGEDQAAVPYSNERWYLH